MRKNRSLGEQQEHLERDLERVLWEIETLEKRAEEIQDELFEIERMRDYQDRFRDSGL